MEHSNFLDFYEYQIKNNGFLLDKGQKNVIGYLYQSVENWSKWQMHQDKFFPIFKSKLPVPRGVYVWGGVGRGKTFLMDVFFEYIPVRRKMRVHFHEFMKNIHSEMNQLKDQPDPLLEVSKRISKKFNLICFDEFHVSDIADAMILDRLLKGLDSNGVGFVMTSNFSPDDLYPDGLHRNELIPAIQLLKKITEVKEIPQGIDHRRNRNYEQFYLTDDGKTKMNSFFQYPLGRVSNIALQRFFNKYAKTEKISSESLQINGRILGNIARTESIVWFDFKDLCSDYRSKSDYIILSEMFNTILISNIPRLTNDRLSSAKRFIWLIDVLYDKKIRLIVSAQVSPDELNDCALLESEFKRTASRLIEMQSDYK